MNYGRKAGFLSVLHLSGLAAWTNTVDQEDDLDDDDNNDDDDDDNADDGGLSSIIHVNSYEYQS